MALAVSIRFDVRDATGRTSFTKIRVPTGFSLTDYVQTAQALAQAMATVGTGVITSVGVCIGLDLSAATIKGALLPGADRFQKGQFVFDTAQSGLYTKVQLPAYYETNIPSGTDDLDLSDPDVAAFVTAMENGLSTAGGTVSPTDGRVNDVASVRSATEIFRKK